MEFRKSLGIYQQIAEYGLDQVLSGSWKTGDRVPSVRALAGEVGVTPNTVLRAYRDLEELGVIETRRGLGYFVPDAGERAALDEKRRQFVQFQLPELLKTIQALRITPQDLLSLLENTTDRA